MFFFRTKKNNSNEKKEPSAPKKTYVSTSYDWKEKNPTTFLAAVIEHQVRVHALYIDATAFKNPKSTGLLAKAIDEFLIDFSYRVDGRLFELANKSVLLVFRETHQDEKQALLIRLQFTFNDEMMLARKLQILDTDFVHLYETPGQLENLYSKIANTSSYIPQGTNAASGFPKGKSLPISPSMPATLTKKKLRDMTPALLDKLQKSLLQVDFSSLIRRQAVCAVIGKSAPQMIFEEVYVAIMDLRDILLPDVNFVSNPWLFANLTETLDKRVLAHVSQHDDGSLVSNFSLNLNVSTILSDEFMAFDESIPPPLRSSIVLELQLFDIFNDVKAFLLAKAYAQSRGYKICIDGITVDKLKYINRENLDSDLMKIIWHPSFMEVINEDKHFMDYVNKAERAKMILCRVDDARAIDVGNSLGINLYQGRYVQSELYKHRK